eukprot:CAMPEP_0185300202 /NCGR_PEP_ID=MMETSP1363-20130426/11834_1 /TAXON_ID=38817 /ORGANISM="Gephyrocapsa oceanica, Strain RCC1303" /LENGTH=564 /DNA_ID=CAMNT_0027897143 /DNA_START=81 /DNA_END=1778 /DNA_ORIENTATION=-
MATRVLHGDGGDFAIAPEVRTTAGEPLPMDSAAAFPRELPTAPLNEVCGQAMPAALIEQTKEHAARNKWVSIDGPLETEGIAGFIPNVVHAAMWLLHTAATQMAPGYAGEMAPLPRARIRWEGVKLSKVFEPALFDWTEDELPASMEVRPQFKFIDVARAGQSTPVNFPTRSAYAPKAKLVTAGRDASGAIPVAKLPPAMGTPALHVSPCAINMLMRPRIAAMDEVVGGFARTLELLRQPRTLSISLYNRAMQKETTGTDLNADDTETAVMLASRCALSLEKHYGAAYDRVVWFVASPSRSFKETLQRKFDRGKFRRPPSGNAEDVEGAEGAAGLYSRTVTYLGTKGTHTAADLKAMNAPHEEAAGRGGSSLSAKERAVFEGFADWWLLGEPDFVIMNDIGTFAHTAAARRPHASSVYATRELQLECGAAGSAVPMFAEGALAEHEARSFALTGTKYDGFFKNRAHKGTLYKVAEALAELGTYDKVVSSGSGHVPSVFEAEVVDEALKGYDKDGAALAQSFEAMLADMANVGKAWRGGADGKGKMLVELPNPPAGVERRAKVEL